MDKLADILFPLRWPLTALWLTAFGIVWWWLLLPSIGGAAGLAGVMGFLPFYAWQNAIYYVVSIDIMVLLLVTLYYAVPQKSDRLVRVWRWRGPALASASLAAAVVSMGFLATLLDRTNWWLPVLCPTPNVESCEPFPSLAMLAIFWAFWAGWLKYAPTREDRYRRLGTLIGWVAIGSMVLLPLAGLVEAWSVRVRGPVWFQIHGAYTGLVLGAWSLLWASGAALLRLNASAGYRRLVGSGSADRSQEPDAPSLRGAMPLIFLGLYRVRLAIFTAVALMLTFWVWMLVMDVVIRMPMGGLTLKVIDDWWRVWMAPDHLTRGMLGIYPASKLMHWLVTIGQLGLFVVTQWFFIRPELHWARRLAERRTPTWSQCMAAAIPAAALTIGIAATIWELHGHWYDLTHAAGSERDRRYYGLILQPTFWKSLPTIVGSWCLWAALFKLYWRRGDGFYQRIQMLFWLFSIAGIELLASGTLHARLYGFYGEYYNRGTYTTAGIAAAVMLWTLVPGVSLLYAGGVYSLQRLQARRSAVRAGPDLTPGP